MNPARQILLEDARRCDDLDRLAHWRDAFHMPLRHDGTPVVYLCGNSLGLQPRAVQISLQRELDLWARRGVEGHFEGDTPWYDFHEPLASPLATLVGAQPDEVVVMNSLTTNLHLLMASFYRPTPARFKILMEGGAFPSDRYALRSQAAWHGFDPDEAVIEVAPREDALIHIEDIEAVLADQGESVSLLMFGGVNYYTGQVLDMARITRAGHAAGAQVGFDLAHAVGNVALALHDWDIDFAVWCSYKYLNAGPGAVGGAFVHARHAARPELPRLAGWWGNDPTTRFDMAPTFIPQHGAAGWQLSNAPVLSMASLRASLRVFHDAGWPALIDKSQALHAFARDHIAQILPDVEVITPEPEGQHGCQLSLRLPVDAKACCEALGAQGILCDFRRPDVLRWAPVPLYNRFADVAALLSALRTYLDDKPGA